MCLHGPFGCDQNGAASSPSIGDAHIIASAATAIGLVMTARLLSERRAVGNLVTYAIGRLIYDEGGDAYYHRDSSGDWVAGFGYAIGANSVGPGALVNAGRWLYSSR